MELINRKDFEQKYCPILNPYTKEKTIVYEPSQQNVTKFQDFIINKSAWTVKKKDDEDIYVCVPGLLQPPIALGYIFTTEPWENNRIIVDIYG